MSICVIVGKLAFPETLEVKVVVVFHVFCCIFTYMAVMNALPGYAWATFFFMS